jgi:hypothetical protein
MKRYIFILSLICLLQFSCKDFLELPPIDQPNGQIFYRNADDMQVAVNAAYGFLQTGGQYSGAYSQLSETRSDNTTNEDIGGNQPAAELDQFRMTSTNEITDGMWRDSYRGILACNVVLDRITGVAMDESIKNRFIGEVKFLRSLMYFNLVRTFGDVPLVLAETKSVQEGYKQGRIASTQVYDQIITDLLDAEKSLPLAYSGKDIGRATKGAAKALLGKVYLTVGNYTAAANKLKEVVDQGNYQLLKDYAALWITSNENHAESIFEVQYKKGGTGTGSYFYAAFAPRYSGTVITGIGFGSGRNLPTADLINAYEPGDLRKSISLAEGFVLNGTFVKEPYTLKYRDQPFSAGDADNNWPVLRYADVMLMYAEALNNTNNGPTAEAYDMVNAIRKRAGLNPLPQGLDFNAFFLALEHERQVELAFEGHRWFDLVRTGRALQVMQSHFKGNISVEEYQLIYPVPNSQIDVNPEGIKQNPGYGL